MHESWGRGTLSRGSLLCAVLEVHLGFLLEPQAVECPRCRPKSSHGSERLDQILGFRQHFHQENLGAWWVGLEWDLFETSEILPWHVHLHVPELPCSTHDRLVSFSFFSAFQIICSLLPEAGEAGTQVLHRMIVTCVQTLSLSGNEPRIPADRDCHLDAGRMLLR